MANAVNNTSNIFSVQELSRRYVESQMGPEAAPANAEEDAPVQEPNYERLCKAYNFKVTGFNVSTALTIASFALAIITGSVLFAMTFALSYTVRQSFYKAVICTGIEDTPNAIFERMVLNQNPTRDIAEHLNIEEDANWQMNSAQLLDFVLWMNGTPAPRQVEQPANRVPVGNLVAD